MKEITLYGIIKEMLISEYIFSERQAIESLRFYKKNNHSAKKIQWQKDGRIFNVSSVEKLAEYVACYCVCNGCFRHIPSYFTIKTLDDRGMIEVAKEKINEKKSVYDFLIKFLIKEGINHGMSVAIVNGIKEKPDSYKIDFCGLDMDSDIDFLSDNAVTKLKNVVWLIAIQYVKQNFEKTSWFMFDEKVSSDLF